jgi:hypothetical protein
MNRYEVVYKLPTTGNKYHKMNVTATTQVYANKIFESDHPSAKRCGNAKKISF